MSDYNNYKTVKCCFNCKNRYVLYESEQSVCSVNIIDKDTRKARYLKIKYQGLCDLWEDTLNDSKKI